MPTLVEPQLSVRTSIRSTEADELDFTIPLAPKQPESLEILTVRLKPRKYRKNLILAVEVTAVVVFILSCGGYAVYALFSLTK